MAKSDTPVGTPSQASDPKTQIQTGSGERDTTPPDDHDEFLKLQKYSFKAMKQFAAKRKKAR